MTSISSFRAHNSDSSSYNGIHLPWEIINYECDNFIARIHSFPPIAKKQATYLLREAAFDLHRHLSTYKQSNPANLQQRVDRGLELFRRFGEDLCNTHYPAEGMQSKCQEKYEKFERELKQMTLGNLSASEPVQERTALALRAGGKIRAAFLPRQSIKAASHTSPSYPLLRATAEGFCEQINRTVTHPVDTLLIEPVLGVIQEVGKRAFSPCFCPLLTLGEGSDSLKPCPASTPLRSTDVAKVVGVLAGNLMVQASTIGLIGCVSNIPRGMPINSKSLLRAQQIHETEKAAAKQIASLWHSHARKEMANGSTYSKTIHMSAICCEDLEIQFLFSNRAGRQTYIARDQSNHPQAMMMVTLREDKLVIDLLATNPNNLVTLANRIMPQVKGTGSFLMQTAETIARAKGISVIELEAYPSSIRFYEKCGFKIIKINKSEQALMRKMLAQPRSTDSKP